MPQYELLPDLPNYDPEPADGVRVGESPVPGLTLKRILRGHTDVINRIAWSPDGRFLASPSTDKTIRIWDVARGECTAVLEGHEDSVSSVAWSPLGTMLASGSMDSSIRIWNIATKSLSQILQLEERTKEEIRVDWINTIAWSTETNQLFSSSGETKIHVWDTFTGKVSGELEGHSVGGVFLAESPSGHLIASASDDYRLLIWKTSNGELIKELLPPQMKHRALPKVFHMCLGLQMKKLLLSPLLKH